MATVPNQRLPGSDPDARNTAAKLLPPAGALLRPFRTLGKAIYGWLDGAPLADPVEKRNAPFLQLIFLLFGLLLPSNITIQLLTTGPVNVGYEEFPLVAVFDMATDGILALSAWTGIYLVRHGRLRRALILFLSVLLGSLALMAVQQWARGLMIDPTFPVLSLVLGGLILGRGALWKIFGCLIGILLLMQMNDVVRAWLTHTNPPSGPNLIPHFAVLFFVITAVLDRTISALRDSMETSARQSKSLARANELLRREMAERERAQEQLIHAQKMEAVGRIASGVAHDFDNVLNVVLGFAARRERIAQQGNAALVEALEGVDLAARRALAISRKLLNFSRQDFSRPEIFDAAVALRELQPMLRQLFDDDIRMRMEIADEPLPVFMDREQFELMALNIAANARDAMPEGGRFVVVARRAAGAPSLELELRDNGAGMPEPVRQHVFDPFYTTKPTGSGTGLGLTVVHDLVKAANGSIEVDSAPGAGTAFRIRLPLAARADCGDRQLAANR